MSKYVNYEEMMKTFCVYFFKDPLDCDGCIQEEGCEVLRAYADEHGIDMKQYAAQVKWERDIAIGQLEDIGKSLGEVMDDVAKVVRCKDCKHRCTDTCKLYTFDSGYNEFGEDYAYEEDKTTDDFFCADGEWK